jgi:ferredoxin
MQGPEDWRHQLGTWPRQHGWDKCIRCGRCRVGALGAGMLGMSSWRVGMLGGMLGMTSSRWVGMLDGMFGLSSWWVGTSLNGVLGVSSWWVGTLDGMLCVSSRQVGVHDGDVGGGCHKNDNAKCSLTSNVPWQCDEQGMNEE